eukprot:comp21260_c0_seq1/m.28982 comp21260_c0_seq1/g.28982  ORF comp21260_c0_seq1/g.28982 comp21260_c0_seq1/m.28982 type:complete len:329 (+) comp21260_c0_seq1:66-1052(+)
MAPQWAAPATGRGLHTTLPTFMPCLLFSSRACSLILLLLLLLPLLFLLRAVAILQQLGHLPLDQGHSAGRQDAERYQVEEGRLCGLVYVHDIHGGDQSSHVCHQCAMEVCPCKLRCTLGLTAVETEKKRNENAWDDNIAQPQHGEVLRPPQAQQKVLREQYLDGCLERLGHRHHHVRAKHPEYVVAEQTPKQNATHLVCSQCQDLDTVDRKAHAKDIICHPMLLIQVPPTKSHPNHRPSNVAKVEAHIEQFLHGFDRLLSGFCCLVALSKAKVEGRKVVGGKEEREEGHKEGAHNGGNGKNPEAEEIHGQEHVDVLLAKNLEDHVHAK